MLTSEAANASAVVALQKSLYTGQSIKMRATDHKADIVVFVRFEYTRRVKAGHRTNPGRENPVAGLHASRDSLYLITAIR